MAIPPAGLTITYQGIICGPEFELTRSVGLRPDFGYVHVHKLDLKKVQILESIPGVDLATGAERERGVGFLSSGELVFAEVAGGKEHRVRIKQVLVAEQAIESPIAFDDDVNDLLRVQLTDIRYVWDRRGIVFAWINVPKQGDADEDPDEDAPPDHADGVELTTGDGGVPEFTLKTQTAPRAPDGRKLIPSSCDAGKPWTLRRALETKVLPALPGTPKLARLPKDLETAIPGAHVWDGDSAVHAFAELLDEFQLVVSLTLDSDVALWHENEGDLRELQASGGASSRAIR